nr:hypothetical protein B0A51_11095 [Rachicladosporium sp. CCFEE 5018]
MESRKNSHSLHAYHGSPPQATTINWRSEVGPSPDYGQHGSNDSMAYLGQETQQHWPMDLSASDWSQASYNGLLSTDSRHGQTISPDEDILQGFFVNQDAVANMPMDQLITNSRVAPVAFGGHSEVLMNYPFNHYAGQRSAMSEPGVALPQISEHSDEASSEQDSAYQTQPTELASNVDYVSQPSAGYARHDAGSSQRREGAASAQHRRRPPVASTRSDRFVPTSSGRGKHGPSQEQLICSMCNYQAKNASDASKHYNKHAKPFKCDLPPCCNNDTGFATSNDLDRHLKSGKHNMKPQKGSGKGYICSACTVAPDSEAKWWPRLDNFKAHINRRHKEHPVDQLVRMSERDANNRPFSAVTEYGDASTHYPGTSVVDRDEKYQHMDSGATDSAMTRSYSVQGEHSLWLGEEATLASASDQLAGVGKALHVANHPASRPFDVARTYRPNTDTGPRLPSATDAAMNGLDLADLSVPRIVLNGPLSVPMKRPPDETWELSTAKRMSELSSHRIADSLDDCDSEGPFTCKTCRKTKARKCDLKKHQKRHTRPYGCTAPRCYARQGSRSDWKRHEEKQHVVRPSWKCILPLESGETCSTNFYLDQHFDKHLAQTHRCSQKDIDTHRQAMHLGRDAHGQFWCGFCKNIVLSKPGANVTAKQYRLAHIGEHFDKEHMVIDDWVCLELNKPHGQIRKEEKRQARADYNKPGSDHGISELQLDDRNEIAPPSSMVKGKIVVDAPLFCV